MEFTASQITGFTEKIRVWPWRTISIVVTVSFIVASAVSTAIGYMMMEQTLLEPPAIEDTDSGGSWSKAPTLTQQQLDKILERNLFNSAGQIGDVDPNAAASGPNAAKTTLPIKVVGIIYGGNPYSGLAMIENTEKQGSVNSFLVGDILAPEAGARNSYRPDHN